METIDFELSDEQTEQLAHLLEKISQAAQVICDALAEFAEKIMEFVRALAEHFGRFFLKMQLLEWCIPMRWADLISQKVSWYWAARIGFWWFERKFASVER